MQALTHALTEAQIAAWRRDGFLSPFPLLDAAERQACLDGLARYERWLGGPVNGAAEMKWRTMPYLILPWAARLARDPRILDRIEMLIGPDILVYTSTFFIKEAGSPTIAAWHQDVTYYGIAPLEVATAWIALTEASRAAGCMDALPFAGQRRQMQHQARVVEHSVNRAAQRIVEPLDEARAVPMPLEPGQFSLHDGLCPHRSGANSAGHRRIGLGINYIPATARSTGTSRPAAMLVRGRARHDGFELMEPATAELDQAGLAAHERAVALYRANYVEQEARHAALAAAS